MKKSVLLLALLVLFASCSSAPKNTFNPQLTPDDFIFYENGEPVLDSSELADLNYIESSAYTNSSYTMPTGIKAGDTIEAFGQAYPEVTVSCASPGKDQDSSATRQIKGKSLKDDNITSITFHIMISDGEVFEYSKDNLILYKERGYQQYRWLLGVKDAKIDTIFLFGWDYSQEDIQKAIDAFDDK